ncbi:alpha/beta fold hydrolase [Kitasatospora sp. NPDC006697]|uniref:alpha/beta fold hydrolase n=1 Tax=Kitasatospora sp. NPDC006697 TaxID=3364020 RepID=UPI0036A58DCD
MPHVNTNGIQLAYQHTGEGPAVLLIMGSSAGGQVWTMHQTPALNRAGYRTVTFDHRGIAPSDAPAGRYSMEDMVADTLGLIEELDLAPCRVVGVSLGSMIAQELAIRHPELITCAVLIATRARADALRVAITEADRALADSGVRLPASYAAVTSAMRLLSPRTLSDSAAAAMWLEVLELSGDSGSGVYGHNWIDTTADHREALKGITAPCRVIAFADDLVTPPQLCAEVADLIPDCDLVEIPDCGHIGYLERPEAVNAAIIEFLDKHSQAFQNAQPFGNALPF